MSENKISLPSTLESLKGKLVRLELKDGQTVIEGIFKGTDSYSDPRKNRVFLVIETKGRVRTLLFESVRDWQEIEDYTPRKLW